MSEKKNNVSPQVGAPSTRIAHLTPQFGLSRLFKHLPKGQRKVLDEVFCPKSGVGNIFHFRGPEELNISDQTLLFILVELAQIEYRENPVVCRLGQDCAQDTGRALWDSLQYISDCSAQTVSFAINWSDLIKRYGSKPGGATIDHHQKQIQRLCEVTVWELDKKTQKPIRQSRLVSWLKASDRTVHLALNVSLAAAIMGGHYVKINISERMALKSEMARAIHTFISTALGSGSQMQIGMQTLIERFWSNDGSEEVNRATGWRRRSTVRVALSEIASLGSWKVESLKDDELFVIRRVGTSTRATGLCAAEYESEAKELSNRVTGDLKLPHSGGDNFQAQASELDDIKVQDIFKLL